MAERYRESLALTRVRLESRETNETVVLIAA